MQKTIEKVKLKESLIKKSQKQLYCWNRKQQRAKYWLSVFFKVVYTRCIKKTIKQKDDRSCK